MNHEPDLFPAPEQELRLSPDFQDRVISRIHREHRIKKKALNLGGACLLLTVSLFLHLRSPAPAPSIAAQGRAASAAKGVAWLVKSQTAQGHWQSQDWGGHAAFNQGVSALATLALLQAPDPVPADILDKAIRALEKSLREADTSLEQGPEFYNRILTLNTLLEAEKTMPDPERKQLLQREFASILRQQQRDGGWGYAASQPLGYSERSEANSAVTWWVCHLLRESAFLNLPGSETALQEGNQWLRNRRQPDGEMAYQPGAQSLSGPESALFWMSALLYPVSTDQKIESSDAYRDFFRLAAAPDEKMLRGLQDQQSDTGSWENAQDRWWRAGGKVYLTALSVLTQVPRGV
ncbi:MAG: hypothetical protein ACO3N7_10540 [Kiritimatiellia bacterium]